jgi:hypothetical protein
MLGILMERGRVQCLLQKVPLQVFEATKKDWRESFRVVAWLGHGSEWADGAGLVRALVGVRTQPGANRRPVFF